MKMTAPDKAELLKEAANLIHEKSITRWEITKSLPFYTCCGVGIGRDHKDHCIVSRLRDAYREAVNVPISGDVVKPLQGPKFLTLFDVNGSGPFSDKEISDIRECSWNFMLDDGNKGTLAHMVFRLADEIARARPHPSPKESSHD